MPFSLGSLELLLLAVLAVPVGLLFAFRHRSYRVGVALIACTALAAVITPADLASTVLLSVAFIGVFVFGSRYHLGSPAKPTQKTLMNALDSTPVKFGLSIVAVAICLVLVGTYYAAAVAEYRFGYLVFRAWAFNTAGLVLLAIGCSTCIADLTWRRMRPSNGLSKVGYIVSDSEIRLRSGLGK